MATEYFSVGFFMLVGVGFVVVTLLFSRLLRPASPNPEKLSTYECGERPVGGPHIQLHIRFYLIALVYIVFAVETVFLYPWAVVFKELGLFAFIEMLVFIGILIVGLAYAWQKGALEWA